MNCCESKTRSTAARSPVRSAACCARRSKRGTFVDGVGLFVMRVGGRRAAFQLINSREVPLQPVPYELGVVELQLLGLLKDFEVGPHPVAAVRDRAARGEVLDAVAEQRAEENGAERQHLL